MKEIRVKGLGIQVPDGSAFTYETPPNMFKAHQLGLINSPRGFGKTTLVCNILKQMKYDKIIVISPSVKSNQNIMSMLNIDEDDIYDDIDNPNVLEEVKAKIDNERDMLVEYRDKKEKYKKFLSKLNSQGELIDDDLLLMFYNQGVFTPPTHWNGGKPPKIAVLFDDMIGSGIFTKGIRQLNAWVVKHRHQSPFPEGGALGCSLFFLVQSYKAQNGGISKCIRNNTTLLCVGRTKSEKELQDIAEECGAEVDIGTFMNLHKEATQDSKFDYLIIDFHKKDNHPSMFRKNLDTFLLP
jgi:hypothetical protein